jgi:hypothetical protein
LTNDIEALAARGGMYAAWLTPQGRMIADLTPRTCSTASDINPHDRITSSTPWLASQSSMNVRNGRPANGITGFGVVSVSGRSRVPSPPARTSACTC